MTTPTKPTARMDQLEYRRERPLEELIRAGLEAGQTFEEIAADLGISRNTLFRWMQAMGAQVRRTVVFPHRDGEVMPDGSEDE